MTIPAADLFAVLVRPLTLCLDLSRAFLSPLTENVTPFTKSGIKPCLVERSRRAIFDSEEGECRDSSTPLRSAQNDKLSCHPERMRKGLVSQSQWDKKANAEILPSAQNDRAYFLSDALLESATHFKGGEASKPLP